MENLFFILLFILWYVFTKNLNDNNGGKGSLFNIHVGDIYLLNYNIRKTTKSCAAED